VTAISGQSVVVSLQGIGGGVYAGTFIGGYSPGTKVSYYFVVQDKLGKSIPSDEYNSDPTACGPVAR
jgi:hypothetical protein